jgi:4-hydroxysphinganine ceramide fatty acyl 2-hydroxylase
MSSYAFIVGLFMWTFMEYFLHRFAFHSEDKWLPKGNTAMTLHFMFHGIHHAFPMDKLRLVFPPVPAFFLFQSVFKPLYSTIVPDYYYHAVMAGTIFGYVCYDMIHYWTHHFETNCSHLQSMKKYHLVHHYRNGEAGFGVSS